MNDWCGISIKKKGGNDPTGLHSNYIYQKASNHRRICWRHWRDSPISRVSRRQSSNYGNVHVFLIHMLSTFMFTKSIKNNRQMPDFLDRTKKPLASFITAFSRRLWIHVFTRYIFQNDPNGLVHTAEDKIPTSSYSGLEWPDTHWHHWLCEAVLPDM